MDLPPSSSGSDADSAAEEGDEEIEQQSDGAETLEIDTGEMRAAAVAAESIAEMMAVRVDQGPEDLSGSLKRATLSGHKPVATISS